MLFAISFHRPLALWANNVHTIPSIPNIMVVGLVSWLLAMALAAAFVKMLQVSLPAASLASAVVVTSALVWDQMNGPFPGGWILLAVFAGWIGQRLRGSSLLDGVIWVVVAMLGLAPIVEVGIGLPQVSADGYVVEELKVSGRTGKVEDVMLVVVDGYPSLFTARSLFGHDGRPLQEFLHRRGFTVPDNSWSTVTATSGSVASMLSLGSLDMSGTTADYSALHAIMGGDNSVASSLGKSGFTYTHIESGWGGTLCSEAVDHCVSAPALDPALWTLLRGSVLGSSLEERFGHAFAHSALRTVQAFGDVAQEIVGDGEPDYIFAHILLPHPPLVVDGDCQVVLRRARTPAFTNSAMPDRSDWRAANRGQLQCTDRMIREVSSFAKASTAMVITSDHGTDARGQMHRAPTEWTDSDISERLGVFIAYRFPDTCQSAEGDVTVLVMRALVECSLDIDLDLPPPISQILVHPVGAGTGHPVMSIPHDRVERIRAKAVVRSNR